MLQLPHLNPFPAPHSVVVLDNCQIHKNNEFVRLIESVGAVVEYLPPYSPQYNPVGAACSTGWGKGSTRVSIAHHLLTPCGPPP